MAGKQGRPLDLRPELAEAIGTFALVLAGCGAIMANALQGGVVGHLGIALAFGFTIAVMVYALGHVSGAHFNPAISVAFAVTGHFPWRRVPTYISAQVLGALTAAGVLRLVIGAVADVGATTVAPGFGLGQGVVIEVLATAILAFVIVAVATDVRAQRPAAGLAIGLAVAVGALFAGPLTGGSMNPARSLGPALVTGQLAGLWVYIVGPLTGAMMAMGLYEIVRPGEVPRPAGRPAADPAARLGARAGPDPAEEVV